MYLLRLTKHKSLSGKDLRGDEVRHCPDTNHEEGWEMGAQGETKEEVGLPG